MGLEDAPERGSDRRAPTPERIPASKRGIESGAQSSHARRRLEVDVSAEGDIAMSGSNSPAAGLTSPMSAWYDDLGPDRTSGETANNSTVDARLNLLDETDRKILASVILNVDVTEVYSPERVNRLAKKFGLVPGASMDLTNGYDFCKPEDRRRAWANIKQTSLFLVIGSPHARCLVTSWS